MQNIFDIIAMLSEWLFTSVSNTKSSKCVIFYTIWLRLHFSMQWCNNEISWLCTNGGMHSYVYVKGLPLPVLRSSNEFDRYVIFYIIGQSYLQKQFHISCIGTTWQNVSLFFKSCTVWEWFKQAVDNSIGFVKLLSFFSFS